MLVEILRWVMLLDISLAITLGVMHWVGVFRKPDPKTQRLLERIEQEYGQPISRKPVWLLPLEIILLTVSMAVILDAVL